MEKTKLSEARKFVTTAIGAGCPCDQASNFIGRGYIPLLWQWRLHAAAREADKPDGPVKIGAGGARGPGKSHGIFAQVALDDCQRVPALKGLFLRQTGASARESFEDLVSRVLLGNMDYRFNRADNTLTFPNASRMILGGFHEEKDIDKYIGIEYDFIAIEEMNQLTKEKVDKLLGSMRTSKAGWRPRLYASFNPGGIGHAYVKDTFVEPYRIKTEDKTRYIPATYKDNRYLNIEYVDYLEGLEGDLGRAWREGDFDIFEGQFFKMWRRDMHVRIPHDVPDTFRRFIGIDFGSTKPFAAYWIAQDWDKNLWVYREYYQEGKTAEDNFKAVVAMTPENERVEMAVMDKAAFSKQGYGETIADIAHRCGIGIVGTKIPWLEPSMGGANSRVARAMLFSNKLNWNETKKPQIYFFEHCINAIRTIPTLVHDTHRPEDVDTEGEDHAYDAITYLIQKLEDTRTRDPSIVQVENRLDKIYNLNQDIGTQINTQLNRDL